MDILRFSIPFPPSINHYYIHTSRGVILGKKGKKYRNDVFHLLHDYRHACGDKRLVLTLNAFMPDRRKRDLDNLCKATLDALQYACVFDDDAQIDMLTVIRRGIAKGGYIGVWICESSEDE